MLDEIDSLKNTSCNNVNVFVAGGEGVKALWPICVTTMAYNAGW